MDWSKDVLEQGVRMLFPNTVFTLNSKDIKSATSIKILISKTQI